MRKKLPLALCSAAVVSMSSMSALATPPSFMDDLVTPATYDVNSLITACTTGVGPKWTVYGTFDAEYIYQHLVVGGGAMTTVAASPSTFSLRTHLPRTTSTRTKDAARHSMVSLFSSPILT